MSWRVGLVMVFCLGGALPALAAAAADPVIACAAQQGVKLPSGPADAAVALTPSQQAVVADCLKSAGRQANDSSVLGEKPLSADEIKARKAVTACAAQQGVMMPGEYGQPMLNPTPEQSAVIDACLKSAGLGPNVPPHQTAAEKAATQKMEAQYRAAQSCAIQQNVHMPDAGDATALINPTPAETAVIMTCLQTNGLGPQAKPAP